MILRREARTSPLVWRPPQAFWSLGLEIAWRTSDSAAESTAHEVSPLSSDKLKEQNMQTKHILEKTSCDLGWVGGQLSQELDGRYE